MGSTDAIINSESTFATILAPGVWPSGGYSCYMALPGDEAVGIFELLIRAIDSDRYDPDPADKPSEPDRITKRLRTRTPPPPMIAQDRRPAKKPTAVNNDELPSVNPETSYTSS